MNRILTAGAVVGFVGLSSSVVHAAEIIDLTTFTLETTNIATVGLAIITVGAAIFGVKKIRGMFKA